MNAVRKNQKLNALRCIIFTVAVLFVIYGAMQGEVVAVLRKASIVCLECIGIG